MSRSDALISRRQWVVGAALASASVPLASCHHASTSSSGRHKVRLTYGITSLAKTRGVFEKTLSAQGVDVEWIGPFPNHAPTLQAVATNTADFSFGGSSTPAMQAILSGAKLKFAAWGVSSPRTTSILVLPSSGITSVAGLVGKTVAVNRAGVAEFVLVAALEKYHVPRDQVHVVYLNPPDAAPAFSNGKIDAWAIWSGPLELAEVQYGAQSIFEEGKELDREIDFSSYLVREDYAAQEPETIRKVIRAHHDELAWAASHHDEALAIAWAVSKYPAPVIEKIGARHVTSSLRFIDDEGISQLQYASSWLARHQVLSGDLDVAQHSVRL